MDPCMAGLEKPKLFLIKAFLTPSCLKDHCISLPTKQIRGCSPQMNSEEWVHFLSFQTGSTPSTLQRLKRHLSLHCSQVDWAWLLTSPSSYQMASQVQFFCCNLYELPLPSTLQRTQIKQMHPSDNYLQIYPAIRPPASGWNRGLFWVILCSVDTEGWVREGACPCVFSVPHAGSWETQENSPFWGVVGEVIRLSPGLCELLLYTFSCVCGSKGHEDACTL